MTACSCNLPVYSCRTCPNETKGEFKVMYEMPKNFSAERWHGKVIAAKGNVLQLCGKNCKFKVVGIYNVASKIKGFTVDGKAFEFDIPAGIRFYGEAEAVKGV